MGSRPTIRDVAERAGVSNATVSNVINEKGKVSESTRKDVLEAIEALNYRPNASAQRNLQSNGPKSIGLLRALRELGIDVPGEVSVAGFDNIKTCAYAPVPLTTMGVPTAEMGRAAVEMVVRQIEARVSLTPSTCRLS